MSKSTENISREVLQVLASNGSMSGEDLGDFSLEGIQWAIVGGESDHKNPRPMKTEWAEKIRMICQRFNVAFFLKQMGGKAKCDCCGAWGCSMLEGVQYLEFPVITRPKPLGKIC